MTNRYFDPEVWDTMVDAIETRFLRTEFEEGEFRVDHNTAARTITVIRTGDRRAWTLMDTTGSHFDSQNRVVIPAWEPGFDKLPPGELDPRD